MFLAPKSVYLRYWYLFKRQPALSINPFLCLSDNVVKKVERGFLSAEVASHSQRMDSFDP